jgi:hypothetical protein
VPAFAFCSPNEVRLSRPPQGLSIVIEPVKMRVAPPRGQLSRNSCALRQLRAQSMFVIVEENQSGAIV